MCIYIYIHIFIYISDSLYCTAELIHHCKGIIFHLNNNTTKDGRVGAFLVYSKNNEEAHVTELKKERETVVRDEVRKIMKEQVI